VSDCDRLTRDLFYVAVAGMNDDEPLPNVFVGRDGDQAASNVTPPELFELNPSNIAGRPPDRMTTLFRQNSDGAAVGHYDRPAAARAQPTDIGGLLGVFGRQNRRVNKRRPRRRKVALPGVSTDDQGAVCLPPSDTGYQHYQQPAPRLRRQDSNGRTVMPAVARNSNGEVYLPAQQRRPSLQPDSELTPSSLVREQIDNIYDEVRRGLRPAQTYFTDGRRPDVVPDEGSHPVNEEEDSVWIRIV